jgi:hypothetical protein
VEAGIRAYRAEQTSGKGCIDALEELQEDEAD